MSLNFFRKSNDQQVDDKPYKQRKSFGKMEYTLNICAFNICIIYQHLDEKRLSAYDYVFPTKCQSFVKDTQKKKIYQDLTKQSFLFHKSCKWPSLSQLLGK